MRFSAIIVMAGLALGLANAAYAATVTIAGTDYDESAFADDITLWSGQIQTFDVGGNGVTDADVAIGGAVSDGISCSSDGCSFLVSFNGGVVNGDGADIAIYGLGVTGVEQFDIAVPGGRLFDQMVIGTGEFLGQWEIGLLLVDLSDLNVALGDALDSIKIIVNRGGFTEEFVSIASLNSLDKDVLVNPIPAAAWLFGSALIGGGVISRKRKKHVSYT